MKSTEYYDHWSQLLSPESRHTLLHHLDHIIEKVVELVTRPNRRTAYSNYCCYLLYLMEYTEMDFNKQMALRSIWCEEPDLTDKPKGKCTKEDLHNIIGEFTIMPTHYTRVLFMNAEDIESDRMPYCIPVSILTEHYFGQPTPVDDLVRFAPYHAPLHNGIMRDAECTLDNVHQQYRRCKFMGVTKGMEAAEKLIAKQLGDYYASRQSLDFTTKGKRWYLNSYHADTFYDIYDGVGEGFSSGYQYRTMPPRRLALKVKNVDKAMCTFALDKLLLVESALSTRVNVFGHLDLWKPLAILESLYIYMHLVSGQDAPTDTIKTVQNLSYRLKWCSRDTSCYIYTARIHADEWEEVRRRFQYCFFTLGKWGCTDPLYIPSILDCFKINFWADLSKQYRITLRGNGPDEYSDLYFQPRRHRNVYSKTSSTIWAKERETIEDAVKRKRSSWVLYMSNGIQRKYHTLVKRDPMAWMRYKKASTTSMLNILKQINKNKLLLYYRKQAYLQLLLK